MDKIISYHILVVEDESIISSKIIATLANLFDPKEIKLASNIKDSLNLLREFEFKIIILDLSLPDGSGITILNKIKESNLNSQIYAFSINTELKRICIKKGATAFFDKSKDFDNLISTVRTAYSK